MHQETTVTTPATAAAPAASPQFPAQAHPPTNPQALPPAAPSAVQPAAPALDPAAWLEQARAAGQGLWRIDGQASLVKVTVRRGGALSRLGHDHVVAARTLTGSFHPGGATKSVAGAANEPARTTFRFRLDAMTVDETDLRKEAGLTSTPTVDAIAGTRHNMLVKVLDAERYPEVLVEAQAALDDKANGQTTLNTAITLHGVAHRYTIPAALTRSPGRITASGALLLKQTDFGITPFSVLGGALAVEDQLELQFTVSAQE